MSWPGRRGRCGAAPPSTRGWASIAARGLTALDWLLVDADAPAQEGYPGRLAAAVAANLAATAPAVDADWRGG
ncbi:hypothetical protein [Rubrimonas cliftonensis]|uniref:hypothetical protein n=1 Tax=Rubrimonas cliftonensis TaxID=89524 RepID=UPI000B89651B|nr:hypothetical protein [Rubrimonas cliftonensis]